MAFKGDLTNISLFDVFQTLSQNRQTGVLVLTRGGQTKKLFISPEGVRLFFTRSFRPLRLGEIFVRRGRITPQDVEILLLEQKKQYRPIGELLIESGKVAEEEIAEVLRYHAEDEIFEVFGWEQGSFAFYDGQTADDASTPLSDILMDPAGLCLEAARRLDELERLREAIPTNDEFYVQADGTAVDPAEVGDAAACLFDALAQPNCIDDLRDLVGLSLHDTLAGVNALLARDLLRPLTLEELLAEADASRDAGEAERAARLLEKAHLHAPQDRGVLERCIDVVGRLNQPRELAKYLAALGHLCLAAGEIDAAIEYLEESLRSDASLTDALRALRDAYAQQGDLERMAEVSARLARAEADQGNLQDALDTCRAGLELAPQAIPLRFFYAQTLARANRVDDAREEIYGIVRGAEGGRAAKNDKTFELLTSCYRLLLKIDPQDAEADAGLREIDRQRMLSIRRRKVFVRGGAAAALLVLLLGVGFATSGRSAASLALEIRKAQQRNNAPLVLELTEELIEAHPDSPEAKWAQELRASIATELSASEQAQRAHEKQLRDNLTTDLDEVREALAGDSYLEALGPVRRFLEKLGRPEMASLRKSMVPQIEWLIDGFIDRVHTHLDGHRQQVALGEVQLRQSEGNAAELQQLEERLLLVKRRDWPRLLPELSESLAAIAESPYLGKASRAVADFRQRLAGAEAAFSNLDVLYYTVRREKMRAEIMDLYKEATTSGQELLTVCEFDRARDVFSRVYARTTDVAYEEPREHYLELLNWLKLRNIPAQMKAQIDRIDHVLKTIKTVEDLRDGGRAPAAYRLMLDLVSENRLIQFEKKYKLPYQVDSVPDGATVEVNGKECGTTPCVVELEIEQRPTLVRLKRDGFADAEAKLVPTDDELTGLLRVDLDKETAWEQEITGGAVEAYPTIADGKVLIGTTDASLLALDLETGKRAWEAHTGLLQRIKARPVVAGKSAYLITLNGVVHEVRLADGKITNRIPLGANVEQDPAVQGETIYIATRRPSLVALAGSNVLWEQPLAESPSTQVVCLDGSVYVGTTKGAILAHDAKTGAARPEFRVRSGTSFWGGLTEHQHLLLAGAEDGKLYAFDTRSGKEAWAYATGGPLAVPAVSDGTSIYLAAHDGYVRVLGSDGKDARERLDMGYVVKARPAIVPGFLYLLGSNRAKAFATGDGRWWDKPFEGEFPVHIVAGKGRILVITDRPWIYAFSADVR